MKVIWEWEPRLEAEKMESSKARFEACQRARNYKTEREKALKHEAFLDRVANAVGDSILMIIVFGMLGAALYFGAI